MRILHPGKQKARLHYFHFLTKAKCLLVFVLRIRINSNTAIALRDTIYVNQTSTCVIVAILSYSHAIRLSILSKLLKHTTWNVGILTYTRLIFALYQTRVPNVTNSHYLFNARRQYQPVGSIWHGSRFVFHSNFALTWNIHHQPFY